MKLGFIVSHFKHEKRVPLLPHHIKNFANELVIEEGLGTVMGIPDAEYIKAGCKVLSREEVFRSCDAIVSLKLLQPQDYKLIREGQMIIGWIHPEVSGKSFWDAQGKVKNLIGVDLDNIHPRIYYQDTHISIPWIPRDFVYKNSFNAGISATMHALMEQGMIINDKCKVAVLGSGNVSQGAMHIVSKFTSNVRMFYRKTLNEFIDNINEYDIVINGIQIEQGAQHVVSLKNQKSMKDGVLIIDAAADGDGAFEGMDYTSHETPIILKDNRYYYCIDNAPTKYYRTASEDISSAFSKWVYKEDISKLYELVKEITLI